MPGESAVVLARAVVEAVERVSPSFVRIVFGGDGLRDVGTPGRVLDQRIKLFFPNAAGELPDLAAAGDDWWPAWLALPEETRGSIRTYSIRDLLVEAGRTRLVVDFVLHPAPGPDPASGSHRASGADPVSAPTGPASRWAGAARSGDELLILGPRRGRDGGGGIEYEPGDAATILLAGDETAAPAIARILEDVDRDVRGVAFIEVPVADDALAIDAPPGVEVRWLPRAGLDHGAALIPAVLEHLGTAATEAAIVDVDTENPLWETPRFSSLGEALPGADGQRPDGRSADGQREAEPAGRAERYFWIAGESGVVTTLRRRLVKDLGVDRAQVAFMGYWRRGVAMRA